ncbi:MAG: outer membrane beta-barrel protein [Pseudomonadota bacterium]
MRLSNWISAACAAIFIVTPAAAQEWYIGGTIGVAIQDDSENSGQTGAFTTGNLGDGSTLDVAAGTAYGWQTEFENGVALGAEAGITYGSGLRSGIEVVYTQADVDTHTGVTLGGGDIGGLDAAALAGAADPLGVTVADLVADGQGEVTSLGVFANVYYDFNRGAQFQPYIGAGIGFVDVDVEYAPSNVSIIDDGETKFAYQLKAGASFQVTDTWELYGEYAYRASDDIEVDNDLFPGTLDVENQQNIFSIGARYIFGR